MHARQQIREAVVTLATGLTTTGGNVYDSRVWELEETNFPFWVVGTDTEESEHISMNKQSERELVVTCSGMVRELTGLAAQQKLDLMAEELETAATKAALTALVPGVQRWVLAATDFETVIDDTDQVIGGIELQFACLFYTAEGAPGALT